MYLSYSSGFTSKGFVVFHHMSKIKLRKDYGNNFRGHEILLGKIKHLENWLNIIMNSDLLIFYTTVVMARAQNRQVLWRKGESTLNAKFVAL